MDSFFLSATMFSWFLQKVNNNQNTKLLDTIYQEIVSLFYTTLNHACSEQGHVQAITYLGGAEFFKFVIGYQIYYILGEVVGLRCVTVDVYTVKSNALTVKSHVHCIHAYGMSTAFMHMECKLIKKNIVYSVFYIWCLRSTIGCPIQ